MAGHESTRETRDLVALGFAVCEVAPPLPDGTCSCRDRLDCRAPGKHPIGKAWLHTALVNRDRRPSWLPPCARLAPVSSYGLVPVPGSGMVVVDRDDPGVLLPMPSTFEVHRASADPRRGHYYFRLADGIGENEVPRSFAGGEIRVAGSGHVVGPGCRHASGDLYAGNGADVGIADQELIDALNALRPVRRSTGGEVEAVLGSRHDWLVRQARKYRGWGWAADRILDELRERNATVCAPPLTPAEFADVERAVEWAMKTITPDRAVVITKRSKRERRGWAR